MRATAAHRTAMLDAVRSAYDSGYIRIYSGTRPTNADTALAGNTLLAELRFGSTAFPAGSAGVLTANTITGEDAALADGTATFARIFEDDGETVLGDMSVSATGDGGEIQFATVSFVENIPVNLTSLTITLPVGS